MNRILLYGSAFSGNFGGPCIFFSTIKILRHADPYAEITFFSQSKEHQKERAKSYIELAGIKNDVFPRYRVVLRGLIFAYLRKHFAFFVSEKKLCKNKYLRQLKHYDVFIDSRGISQTDYFGSGIYGYFKQNLHLISAKLMGLKVIKLTQDMGPFQRFSNRFIAKKVLRKLDLIFARGMIVKELLNEIQISSNVVVQPDSAFLMDIAADDTLNRVFDELKIERQNYIAISCSKQVDIRSEKDENGNSIYLNFLLKCISYIIEKQNCKIILIPNERGKTSEAYDDHKLAMKIWSQCNDKEKLMVLNEDVDAFILKGIISKAKYVIASRYHSVVASLSSEVPVMVVGWGFKYDQLMGLVNAGDFVLNHKLLDFNKAMSMMDRLMNNNEEIRQKYKILIPEIKKQVLKGSDYLKKIFLKDDPQKPGI